MPRILLSLLFLAPLSAAAPQEPCFDGTGGPNGDFDWVVRNGEIFFFDTTHTVVIGGPGGLPTAVQDAVDGEVQVRDLIVEAGGEIRVQGPNPMRILATRDVIVRGRIDVSGFNARDVATLNTGNQIELGGAGAAGGGRGGSSNTNTMGHSIRGQRGSGPFGAPDLGGEGGESAVAPPSAGKDARRPGGGGGGRFARDQGPASLGLAATAGNDGHPDSVGAESGKSPARGGAPGDGPFADERHENDHFGLRPLRRPGSIALVPGELASLSAGAGGGGGGNAIPANVFPNPSWNFASDEKGGPGGGGGGALHVQAVGRIVFGAAGEIRSRGGRGATGENTNFLDHVGGTGGSGSGGHVVLESATEIDFTDGGANVNALPRAWIDARGAPARVGAVQDVNPCCRSYSNGGAGGPGVVQLHVPNPLALPGVDPASDVVVPTLVAVSRDPLDALADPGALVLFPTCDPFPRRPLGWFGAAGDALRARLGLELGPALEVEHLTLSPRF